MPCSECGIEKPIENGSLINGLRFAPRDLGYYGGFTDNQPWIPIEESEFVNLCHDCCLRLMRAFPSIGKQLGLFAHPSEPDKQPCCEFAWSIGRSSLGEHVAMAASFVNGTSDLEWVATDTI